MNRKFLILVATICGLVMVVSLLLFPIVTQKMGDTTHTARAVEEARGCFILLFAWIAAGFSGLVFLKKTGILGMNEDRHLAISFLGYKLAVFFLLAALIAGTRGDASWGVGFWFSFIAGIVGTLAVFLTFNPALAQKLADAAKAKDEDGAPASAKTDTSDDA